MTEIPGAAMKPDVIAEIQARRLDAFIEQEIAALSALTSEAFARYVYSSTQEAKAQ